MTHLKSFRLAIMFSVFTAFLLCAGCAVAPHDGTKTATHVNVASTDRVFFKVVPFDTVVQAELMRLELDPGEVYDDLVSELRYQLYLRKQEESPDSAGATVRITVSFDHLQPGAGNSGNFVAGTLLAERTGAATEKAAMELRQPAKDNVPEEFLSLNLPRALAVEILGRMEKKSTRAKSSDLDYAPPLMLLF